jgi:hypothetical protein
MSKTSSAAKPRAPEWTPEGERRFEVAETFAASIWPWTELDFELAAIDFLTNTQTRMSRASFWALAQIFGPDWGDACRTLIPGVEVKFSDQEVRMILSVSPVTTDERLVGHVAAFGEAAWRFYAPAVDQPETRKAFRAILIDAARKNRQFWIDRPATGRRIEIAPGWFRVEVAEDVAELRRAMGLTADQPAGSC